MLRYKAGSSGQEINLSNGCIRSRLKTAGFREYSWEVESIERKIGSSVSGFKKKAKEYTLEIDFCGTKSERAEAVNQLCKITESDILNTIAGRLYLDEYYINCFVIGMEIGKTENPYRKVQKKAKIYAPYPFWIREHPYYFKSSEITSTDNKRYAGKYAYRYANGLTNTAITNEHYAECNFRLIVYGPCTQPSIYIGGYEYRFNIALQEGEYLEVDSTEETVTKYMKSGVKINAFNNRNFKNSVFQPIQTGRQEVSWNGRFDFDIIMYEERSEPKWS